MSDQAKYPECEKMSEIQETSQSIGEFLNWLNNERGIVLCTYEEARKECYEGDIEFLPEGYYGINESIETPLVEYFGINLVKAEKEKRQMIEEARKIHEKYN